MPILVPTFGLAFGNRARKTADKLFSLFIGGARVARVRAIRWQTAAARDLKLSRTHTILNLGIDWCHSSWRQLKRQAHATDGLLQRILEGIAERGLVDSMMTHQNVEVHQTDTNQPPVFGIREDSRRVLALILALRSNAVVPNR